MKHLRFLFFSMILLMSCNDPIGEETVIKAYVTLQGIDQVAVVDIAGREVMKYVDVDILNTGDRPHYVVVDQSHGYWYVTLISSGYVLKFDMKNDELVDSLKVGNMPALMAIDATTQTLYVSRFMPMPAMGMMGSNSTMINVIDAATMTVTGDVSVGARSPHGIAISSDGKTLWVASNEASHFFKIQTSQMFIEGYKPESFKLGHNVPDSYVINDMFYNALELELSHDDTKLFVTCSGSDEVRVFNTVTGDSLDTYPLSKQPWHLVLSDDDKNLFVTNRSGGSISKINLSSGSVSVLSDSLIALPHGCGLTTDETNLLVSSSEGNRLLVIDTESMVISDVINLETPMSMPTGLAVVRE